MVLGGTKIPVDLARLRATRRHAIIALVVFMVGLVGHMYILFSTLGEESGPSAIFLTSNIAIGMLGFWCIATVVLLGIATRQKPILIVILALISLLAPYLGSLIQIIRATILLNRIEPA